MGEHAPKSRPPEKELWRPDETCDDATDMKNANDQMKIVAVPVWVVDLATDSHTIAYPIGEVAHASGRNHRPADACRFGPGQRLYASEFNNAITAR